MTSVIVLFCQVPINQNIIPIDGTAYIDITSLKKIESDFTINKFEIRKGSLRIIVSGIIDHNDKTKTIISLFAEETKNNELSIIAMQDSQAIQYKVEGIGSGNYAGQYTTDGNFLINVKFKITSPGNPSFLLSLPVHIHISFNGELSNNRCYIAGSGYLYNYNAKKKKTKNRTTSYSP